MNRNTLMEMSGRVMHQAVRMTLDKAIDNPMMQEMNFGGMFGDARKLVERVQAFGFSSVPLPPIVKKAMAAAGGWRQVAVTLPEMALRSSDEGGGGADAGGGGGGEQAEGIALFLGGQRNHPTVIQVDDRRHRPMGLKPGENAQYDDAQQMTLMRRNGLYLLSNDNEDGEGKKAERMVSLRHVEKKKQKRGQVGQAGERPQGQQAQGEDFKHEGETVNLELRVTKKKVEYRNGDEVVAEHDKQSKKWDYKGKQFDVTSSDDANIKPGKTPNQPGQHTNITSPTVNINGSTGVAISGPTSVNGNPVATTEMFIPRDAVIAALEQRIAALGSEARFMTTGGDIRFLQQLEFPAYAVQLDWLTERSKPDRRRLRLAIGGYRCAGQRFAGARERRVTRP